MVVSQKSVGSGAAIQGILGKKLSYPFLADGALTGPEQMSSFIDSWGVLDAGVVAIIGDATAP